MSDVKGRSAGRAMSLCGCGRSLVWSDPLGCWVHVIGLGPFWVKCSVCGWEGSVVEPGGRTWCRRCQAYWLICDHRAEEIG